MRRQRVFKRYSYGVWVYFKNEQRRRFIALGSSGAEWQARGYANAHDYELRRYFHRDGMLQFEVIRKQERYLEMEHPDQLKLFGEPA